MAGLKCGIVFLNTNDGERLNKLIEHIKQYNSIHRIVIVENCSTDGSYELLKRHLNEKVDIVKTDANKGYSYGNNAGIRKLSEYDDVDIIGIANTDVEFEEELVSKIIRDFEFNPDIGILTGIQVTSQGNVAGHPFWGVTTSGMGWLYKRLGFLSIARRVFKIYPDKRYVKRKLNKKGIVEVGVVEGSLFFIRAKLFEKIGYFDDNVFLYCEEDIIASKMNKTRFKTAVDSDVSYIHYGGQTTKVLFTNIGKVKLENRSNQYFLSTYLTKNPLVLVAHLIISSLIVFETHIRNIVGSVFLKKSKGEK